MRLNKSMFNITGERGTYRMLFNAECSELILFLTSKKNLGQA